MSLTQYSLMNRHDPHAYINDDLNRRPTHKVSQIEEVLPHRWQSVITSVYQ